MWPGQPMRPPDHTAPPHALVATLPPAHAAHPMPYWPGGPQSAPTTPGPWYAPCASSSPSWDQGQLMQSFNTMLLAQPPSPAWYMDTGATAHMTSEAGMLSSLFPSAASSNGNVGNGSFRPRANTGRTPLST